MTTAAQMRVHVVVPDSVDDPRRPSGGNVYDRKVCEGLAGLGWQVREHAVPEGSPDRVVDEALAAALGGIPDGDVVLVDGLIASTAPQVMVSASTRLGVVVLVHLPLGHATAARRADEHAVLAAARTVVVTSHWTARWLHREYGIAGASVVHPGTDRAAVADGSPSGGALLSVGPVTAVKGHDLLVAALGRLTDVPWTCTMVGALDIDPPFTAGVRAEIERARIGDRVVLTGPRTGASLDAAYASADLLVLPSRVETYGMVLTEALARGLPVVAARVGGVMEALGAVGPATPGLLVPPDDAAALAGALSAWFGDVGLRERLRSRARARRETLTGWHDSVGRLADVLADVAGVPEWTGRG